MPRSSSPPPTPAPERDKGSVYSRKEVCRLLRIDLRQLTSWEQQQLIAYQDEYRFSDLLALKSIIRLRHEKVPPRRLKQSILALRERLKDIPNVFEEVRVYKEGSRVQVQIGNQKMDSISGQLLFDFNEKEFSKLLQLPATDHSSQKMAETLRRKIEADHWFERGLQLEQTGAPIQEIIEAYQKAAELDPHAAGALVNLGTIFFNGHAWADAEEQYKKALAVDPKYPLAHFNLGNLYDERGDLTEAQFHYQAALKLFPNYADAHYNLALLHQSTGELMDAVRHWKAYLKLDASSSWSQIARRELGKIEAVTVVHGNRSSRSLR